MTVNYLFELQKAIYTTLTNDSELMGQVSGVYNHVPQDTAFPYVVMEEMTAEDASTTTTTAVEVEMDLSVFSRERGAKEAGDIMARIKVLLHDANLALDNGTLIYLRQGRSDIAQAEEGLTWQATITINTFIEED